MQIDIGFLEEFEEQLNPLRPEKSPMPARLVGIGRISASYEILKEGQAGIVYTRMPFFETVEQLDGYEKLCSRYNQHLKEIGLDLPEHGWARIQKKNGRTILYLFRRKQSPAATVIGILSRATNAQSFTLVGQILREMNKVWNFNRKNRSGLEISTDGRLSTWSIPGLESDLAQMGPKARLQHTPEGTPLIREHERELLDSELFLLRAKGVMKSALRRRYMSDVLVRFYDLRRVSLDMLSDLRQVRGSLIGGFTDVANQFLTQEAPIEHLLPLTPEEVKQYHANASDWRL